VPTINALTSSAYYAYLTRIAAETAGVLDKSQDAARYEDYFKNIRADFNARFLGRDASTARMRPTRLCNRRRFSPRVWPRAG